MARLSDADQSRLPLSRLDSRGANRTRPRALPRSGAANAGTSPPGNSGMAELLLQVADDCTRTVSRTRSVHSADEVEEHTAPFERRRADHALGVGILRLDIIRSLKHLAPS